MSKCLYDTIQDLFKDNEKLKEENDLLKSQLEILSKDSIDFATLALEFDYRITLQENNVKENDFE